MSTGAGREPAGGDHHDHSLRWRECLDTAIGYFHAHLDHPLGDHTDYRTPRHYYHAARGWTDTTIEAKRLGWAPPSDENELVAHLRAAGFTDEELLATGLFTKDLRPLWYGRYVLPYFDAEGEAVYAISRSADHSDDFIGGKYGRLAHTKHYARIEEPLYGLETVRTGEPVIVTEGIADAITVHQAGRPCVSPVTTQLSETHRNDLLTAIDDHDVPRVYVIQDAEAPSFVLDKAGKQLTIDQHGPGIAGAIATATFLVENGIDARVNTPPRAGLPKNDLDAYLRDGWGTLDALLASAKPPAQHPAYQPEQATVTRSQSATSFEATDTGRKSGLFQLDVTDVTGLPIGFRGKNPLGHTGDSENYFVIFDGNDGPVAYDHKRRAAYNALTYLLCDHGTRPVGNPNGPLSDEDKFVAWIQAKDRDLLSPDDPVPYRSPLHVALTHELCEPDEITDGWKLPPAVYNTALDVIRDEYGYDPGREYLGDESLASVKTDSDTDDETDGPSITLEEARHRCQTTIDRAAADSDYALIDALPAQGKSRGVIEWAARTGKPLTVLTPRRDLHENEYKPWCDQHDLTYYTLPSPHRDCGMWTGEFGKDVQTRVNALYNAGATGQEIHELYESRHRSPPPCKTRGACSFISKWNFEPDAFDVLLGNYKHAYRDDVIESRVVVVDESPGDAFIHGFDHSEISGAVTHYLEQHDGIPFKNYTDLTENRLNPYRRADALDWFKENDPEVDRAGHSVMFDRTTQAHAYAPLMTYALLVGEVLENDWEHAILPGNRAAARDRNPDTGYGDPDPELWFLIPPNLEDAETVLGLDGTPWVTGWELNLGTSLTHYPVLNDDERAAYIRTALGQTIYQMSDYTRPYFGLSIDVEQDEALIRQVGKWERRLPDLITSKKAETKYEEAGLVALLGKYDHYGNLKGTNAFAESRVGIVIGSPHYGDKYVERWGALAGECVERQGEGKGKDLDYGSFGNEVLKNMREDEVLQALMRFGRDSNGAVIYVSTAALLDWLPIAGRGNVVKWSDGMREVIAAIRDRDEWRTGDLSLSIDERQVRRHLDNLHQYGLIERRDERGGWTWMNTGALADVNDDQQAIRFWTPES